MTAAASKDIWAELRKLGCDLTPALMDATRALLAPLAPRPGPDVDVVRDVFYGPDPRHRLDVFVPSAGAVRAPVLVFVHGGGFVQGDKGAPDAPFYNNVGLWAARSGCIGVTMTYRLAPGARWPAGSEDVGAAVGFLRAGIARWGGDPDSIFLMGQSAGAAHVAGYIALVGRPILAAAGFPAGSPDAGIAGAILISGLYDVTRADRNPFQAAYYGDDASRWAEQSSLERLAETSLPCFYTISEFDPPDFQRQAAWLVEAHACRQGRWPRLAQLTGHNHLSSVLQIGSAPQGGFDTLGPELLRFVHTVRGWSSL
jgi:acetyl esterase/lipase